MNIPRAALALDSSHVPVYCVSFVLCFDKMRIEELLELLSRQSVKCPI